MGGGGAAGGTPYPFPQPPSAVRGAHPCAIIQPLVHQRGCAWRGHPGFDCQGCDGACSASLPRLLQPSVCGVENLGIVVSGHRSLDPQLLHGRVTFPDGDHPVCPAFSPSGRLDGLHRSQGGLPTGSHPSGISPLPLLCGTWPYLSVHSAVLWPHHDPAGFLPGHGSCFRHSPFLGYSTTGWSSRPPASLSSRTSRWYWTSVGSWALSSTRRNPTSSPLRLFSI